MTLLIHTRKEILQYSNQTQPEEGFAAIRQNQHCIFLADPYHAPNFADYLDNDISRIIGNHSEKAKIVMHGIICLPLL